MSAAHTPGPWRVGYRFMDVGCENDGKTGGYAKLFDIRGWGYLTGNGHGGLGLDPETAYEIQQANARLIAAAPDMFEALKEVVAALDGRVHSNPALKALSAAEEAISKAEAQP